MWFVPPLSENHKTCDYISWSGEASRPNRCLFIDYTQGFHHYTQGFHHHGKPGKWLT